jgi:hypothetical protein
MEVRYKDKLVIGTGSESYQFPGFGISVVEPSDSANTSLEFTFFIFFIWWGGT